MRDFDFIAAGRVLFGIGSFIKFGQVARDLGKRAMVIWNGPGNGEMIEALLQPYNVETVLRRQNGEPIVADVDSAVAHAQATACDMVIGIGGGSAIDCAKAVAGLLTNGGSAVDYMEIVGKGLKITRPAAPWIAIPTTAGTGAEATRNAVIGLPEKHFKASIRSEFLLPRAAFINPALGETVPRDVTAASGMDALCQLIESYTSSGASPVTDALALRGIDLAIEALPRAFANGRDMPARADMALAAYLSGVCLTNAGLGAVHGFAAPLGANFPVPHGVVCAALLPHVIEANIEQLRRTTADSDEMAWSRLERYGEVGRRLTGKALTGEAAADACVEVTARLLKDLQIPGLAKFGVTEARIGEMVGLARKASSMKFNPALLSDEALARVLRKGI